MTTGIPLPHKGTALIADPVYNYIPFTVCDPDRTGEATEEDLIDTPWMQRLRRIYQLQSARWVYPSAEHSRFQHSLGTMQTLPLRRYGAISKLPQRQPNAATTHPPDSTGAASNTSDTPQRCLSMVLKPFKCFSHAAPASPEDCPSAASMLSRRRPNADWAPS